MKATVVAPGKMILLGEYAVLEQAPALVAAVNRHASVTIDSEVDQCSVLAPTIDPNPAHFTIDPQTGHVLYDEDVPLSAMRRLKYFASAIKSTFLFFRSTYRQLPPFAVTLDTKPFFEEILHIPLIPMIIPP